MGHGVLSFTKDLIPSTAMKGNLLSQRSDVFTKVASVLSYVGTLKGGVVGFMKGKRDTEFKKVILFRKIRC